jgi:poly-gamma-glutamate synthesis protein (capsule biosynthesis protein)
MRKLYEKMKKNILKNLSLYTLLILMLVLILLFSSLISSCQNTKGFLKNTESKAESSAISGSSKSKTNEKISDDLEKEFEGDQKQMESEVTSQPTSQPIEEINFFIENEIPNFLQTIIKSEFKKMSFENKNINFIDINTDTNASISTTTTVATDLGANADSNANSDTNVNADVNISTRADLAIGITSNNFKNFENEDIPKKEEGIIGSYVLAVVTDFYTYCDSLNFDDFMNFWEGDEDALKYITNSGQNPKLILNRNVFNILESSFGKSGLKNIEIIENYDGSYDDLKNKLLSQENYFSIIPFEQIIKEYKIFNLNGASVFDKNIESKNYPLKLDVAISGNSENKEIINEIVKWFNEKDVFKKVTNLKEDNLTTVIMTGCTALVRGTANMMEKKGVTYPGEKIAEVLRDADITHINNEITFVEGNPRDREDEIVFSSDPKYIELLKYVGTDVVELSGNHMNDYGPQWMIYTLEMYEKEGWQFFAGGRNLEEAYKPAKFDINGNKIAFLGCNQFGPASYWATENKAGAAPPNYDDYEKIIKELKKQNYIVIFTFQHIEVYNYSPVPAQVKDFRRMSDAGADIVSGSQAHHPQAIEFYNNENDDSMIFYGLGNLFFDQMYNDEVRQGIITKHVFYEGKQINTILITTMLEEYCQPRLTNDSERLNILKNVFQASTM